MRLNRLRLQHFRGVADREVLFPDAGVVVLQGANEVGKTSMVEALDLLLTEKDSSTKAQVRSVKPVGADAGSEVQVELTTGPYRITYRKRWHVRPRTELTVHSPVRAQLSGVPAHERVRAILDETVDDGLWKALRLLQGAPLVQGALTGSTALQAALDAAAGGAGGGDAGAAGAGDVVGGETAVTGADVDGPGAQGSLVQAVEEQYSRYFTPTGRLTSAYAHAVRQLTQESQAAVDAGAALQEVTTDVDRHADLATRLVGLEEQRGTARADLAAVEVRWARAELLEAELRRRRTEAGAARNAHAAAAATLRRRRDAEADVRRRSAAVEQLTESLADGHVEVRDHAGSVAAAEGQVASVRGLVARLRTDVDQSRERAEHLQDLADLTRLDAQIDRADAALGELERSRRRLADVPVTGDHVRAIERRTTSFESACARQSAVAPVVLLEALGHVELDVGGERVPLDEGDRHERTVTGSLAVSLPGALIVTVRPGSDAEGLAVAVATARKELQHALARAGVPDLAEARTRYHEHRDAERDLVTAERALSGALGAGSATSLRRRRDEVALRCRRLPADRSDAPDSPDGQAAWRGAEADLDRAVAAARATAEAARARLDDAVRTLDAVVVGCEEGRRRLSARTVELAAVEATLNAARAELAGEAAKLADTRECDPDDELIAAAAATREAADVAAEAEAAAWSALDAADRPALEALLRAARAAADHLCAEWDDCRLALAQVSGRLENAGAQGRQDRYDEAMTRLETAQRHHTSVERRARAANHLRTVLLRHRDAARRRYVAPFAEQVTALGRVVFGPSFAIEVDDDLRIASRTLEGTTVGWELLSTGAMEQLAIITRLACAGLVDETDGVPVILDDALGYSDPDRLTRVADVVALAGRRSQVIVLTCTPDRYRSISDATVVQLRA